MAIALNVLVKSDYRPEIDGLRAIAVLPVVFYHAHFSWFKGGFLGVDVFFVISGFLITSILLEEPSLARFYRRRARRILPALFLVLAASFIAAYFILTPAPLEEFSKSALATILFVANVFFWSRTDYFAEPAAMTPLLHTWSLAVEEQFYVLFPILLIVFARLRRITAGLLILMALSLAGWAATKGPAVFYLTQFRAWELLTGALLARSEQLYGRRRYESAGWIGVALIAFAVTQTDITMPRLGSLLACAGSAIIIYTGGPRTISARPLIAIGLISYSLYLWHQPLFAFTRLYMIQTPDTAIYVALIGLGLALSALSWRFIEQPFRHGALASMQPIWIAGGLLTGLAGMGIALAGLPNRYTTEQLALLSAKPERGVEIIDGRPCRRTVADACVIGMPGGMPSFAVLGDSHAETLTAPLAREFRKLSISAYVFTNSGCPFIAGVVDLTTQSNCDQKVDDAIKALMEKQIKSVIINDRSTAYILGSRFDNGEGGIEPGDPFPFAPLGFEGDETARISAMKSALLATLQRLLNSGITIYYVLPVPEVGWNVPRVLVRGLGNLTTSQALYQARHAIVRDIVGQLSENRNFIPIYPDKIFCPDARCRTSGNGKVFYTDTDHLSSDGADLLVPEIVKAIKASGQAG